MKELHWNNDNSRSLLLLLFLICETFSYFTINSGGLISINGFVKERLLKLEAALASKKGITLALVTDCIDIAKPSV